MKKERRDRHTIIGLIRARLDIMQTIEVVIIVIMLNRDDQMINQQFMNETNEHNRHREKTRKGLNINKRERKKTYKQKMMKRTKTNDN